MSPLVPREEVVKRMQDRYARIKEIGGAECGVLTDLTAIPDWMDRERLSQARATIVKYFMT